MQAIGNEELERRFDEGEDITGFMDFSTARRPNAERMGLRGIGINVPESILQALDAAALRMGVSRAALINVWLAERIDEEADREARRVLVEARRT